MTESSNRMLTMIHRIVSVDILLGLASIPFTALLTSELPTLEMSPVLFAGFVSGVYYGMQSKPVKRSGFRTGAVGSLPILWVSADFVFSQISSPFNTLAFAIVAGVLWFIIAMIINALGAALCAMIGGWVSRTIIGSA